MLAGYKTFITGLVALALGLLKMLFDIEVPGVPVSDPTVLIGVGLSAIFVRLGIKNP